ncbi:unnamed protein product [Allacma fusca]|uniref:Uncharacterized protein n=1 Tax=Allacma fusca TaxID=39272 RepID=A0A8J2PBL6_9HEXA|nr:unnamed protein product [Allacma fusca]
MGLIYLFGLLVLLFSVACIILALLADSDIVTYLYSRYGKQPAGSEKPLLKTCIVQGYVVPYSFAIIIETLRGKNVEVYIKEGLQGGNPGK